MPDRREALKALAGDPAAAARALTGHAVDWMALHDTPESCPWHRAKPQAPADTVAEVFRDVAPKLKSLLRELSKRCSCVLTGHAGDRWHLYYIVERGKGSTWHLDVLVGGPPRAELPEAIRSLGWFISEPLAAFYDIHDGFGPFYGHPANTGVEQIRAASAIETLAVRSNIGEEPDAVLAFYIDGVGDRIGMYWQGGTWNHVSATSPARIYTNPVFWDHESHAIEWGKRSPLQVINGIVTAWLRAK